MRVSLILAVAVLAVTLSSTEATHHRRSYNHVGDKHHKRTLAKRQSSGENTIMQCIMDSRKQAGVCVGTPSLMTNATEFVKEMFETKSAPSTTLKFNGILQSAINGKTGEAAMTKAACTSIKGGQLASWVQTAGFGNFGVGYAKSSDAKFGAVIVLFDEEAC